MIPYTREALTVIRWGIQCGHPPDVIRRELGWDVSMFNNICQRNCIDARVAQDDAGAVKPATSAECSDDHAPPEIRTARQEKCESCKVTMSLEVLDQLDRLARSERKTRNRVVCDIVRAAIAKDRLHRIKLVARVGPRQGAVSEGRLFQIPKSDCEALERAAFRRSGHVSVGMMIKAILYAHFEGQP